MTEKQKAFAERLKRYSENSDEYNYIRMAKKMQHDKTFNDMILDMTVNIIAHRADSNTKYRHKFEYHPKNT